jgi:hypothetical protein
MRSFYYVISAAEYGYATEWCEFHWMHILPKKSQIYLPSQKIGQPDKNCDGSDIRKNL